MAHSALLETQSRKSVLFLASLLYLALPKPHCAPAPVECKPTACMEPQECCTPCMPVNPCRPCDTSDWTAQIRGAAFIPTPHQLSKIYGGVLPALELESSYAVCKNRWLSGDQLQLWENVSWITKQGHTIGFGYPTRLNLVPFSIGMSYKINIGRHTDFYFGVGPTFSLLRIKISNPFDSVHINRNQFGLTTKTGFRFNFRKHYFFDLFGDYYYTQFGKMHNSLQNIDNNFSAFYVGGGFGAKW